MTTNEGLILKVFLYYNLNGYDTELTLLLGRHQNNEFGAILTSNACACFAYTPNTVSAVSLVCLF